MNLVNRFLCLFCLIAPASPALAQNAERSAAISELDRIVAVVNDEVITRIELDRESRMAMEQLRRQGTPLPARDILEKQLLERMITKRALLQYARQNGVRVTDSDIDGAVERIAQENKLTPTTLRQTVERDGIPFDRFREDVRGEMLVARLREREVESRVMVADGEIASFLRGQDSQTEKVDEYNLAHVLVTVPEQATPEEVKNRAHARRNGARSGAARRRFSPGDGQLLGRSRCATRRRHGLASGSPTAHHFSGSAEGNEGRANQRDLA